MTADDISWGFWKRSSYCSHGDCVLVHRAGPVVNVRDSKEGPGGRIQAWEIAEWNDLLIAIIDGDPYPGFREIGLVGKVSLGLHRHLDDGGLAFTEDEWSAFVKGVNRGEFDWDNLPSWADQDATGGGSAGAGGVPAGTHAAGTGGDRAVSPVPAAASSGPNVAAMYVPAGRDSSSPVLETPQVSTGRPGLKPPSDFARRAAREAALASYLERYEFASVEFVKDDLFRAANAAVDAFLEALIAEAAAPLVQTDAP